MPPPTTKDNAGLSFTVDHARIDQIAQAIATCQPICIDPENDLANLLAVALGFFFEDAGTLMDMSEAQSIIPTQELLERWKVEHFDLPSMRQVAPADRSAVSTLLQLLGWRARFTAQLATGQKRISQLESSRKAMHQIHLVRPNEIVPDLQPAGSAEWHLQRIDEVLAVQKATVESMNRIMAEFLPTVIEHDAPGLFKQSTARVSRVNGTLTIQPAEG